MSAEEAIIQHGAMRRYEGRPLSPVQRPMLTLLPNDKEVSVRVGGGGETVVAQHGVEGPLPIH